MDSQLVTLPRLPSPLPVNGEPADVCTAESESQLQEPTQQGSEEEGQLEPGEVPASEIKQEETARDSASNPFKYHSISNGHYSLAVNPFAHIPVTPNSANPFAPSEPQSNFSFSDTPRPVTATQRRNHARFSNIVTRLQNFDGSVTELLAVASTQQQLDEAFRDLDHAKDQLKDVLREFEIQGYFSNRQNQRKNSAIRDLTRASQRIGQLTKKLWDLQHREAGAR